MGATMSGRSQVKPKQGQMLLTFSYASIQNLTWCTQIFQFKKKVMKSYIYF